MTPALARNLRKGMCVQVFISGNGRTPDLSYCGVVFLDGIQGDGCVALKELSNNQPIGSIRHVRPAYLTRLRKKVFS